MSMLRALRPLVAPELGRAPPVANFSKWYGNALAKRLPLTTKRARKGFYKGNGCRSEGTHTSKGGFVMDRSKMLNLVLPDLTGFKVLFPIIARHCAMSETIRDNSSPRPPSSFVPVAFARQLKPYVANATPREKYPLASELYKTLVAAKLA